MRSLLVVAMLLSVCALAQQDEKHPTPVPKNLKFLVGMNGEEVIQVMRRFDASLGTQCVYCHVGEDFANDQKPTKATALMMLALTRDINANFKDGQQHVTCYTCHRGSTEPATQPPAVEGGTKQ